MDKNPDQPPKRTCLGKIVAAHGVKGLVKILPFGDDPSLLNGAVYTSETGLDTLTVTLKNPLGKYILAEVNGTQDRTDAENIRGTELYIQRDQLPLLKEGYYFEDLVDRKTVDKNGKNVGKVISVENYGASDLLEIRSKHGTFFLPFTDEYVLEVKNTEIVIKDYEQFL